LAGLGHRRVHLQHPRQAPHLMTWLGVVIVLLIIIILFRVL
jgi:hypothetical protein